MDRKHARCSIANILAGGVTFEAIRVRHAKAEAGSTVLDQVSECMHTI